MKTLVISLLVLFLVGCQSVPAQKHGTGSAADSSGDRIDLRDRSGLPPGPLALPANWLFYGDSQTDGRAPIPGSVNPVVVFRTIWAASGFDAPARVRIDGGSSRSLAGTATALRNGRVSGAPWIHVQESGNQNQAGQRTPLEFGATFEAFWRAVDDRHSGALKTYETAHSFQRTGQAWRDWQTTANWAQWGYSSEAEAISYNAEMLRRIDILAADGIVVLPVYTAEYMDALIAQIPGGYQSIEAAGHPYHYNGVGNFMVALAMFKALQIDINSLEFSAVAIHPDPATDSAYKTLCLDIVNATEVPW